MKKLVKKLAWYALTLSLLAVYLLPILLMLVGSLLPDEQVLKVFQKGSGGLIKDLGLHNYHDVFRRVSFGKYLLNSLIISCCVVAAGLIVNSLAGYALARLSWRGKKAMLWFVIASLILPLEAIAVPLFYQVTVMGLRDTLSAQIIPFIANAMSIYLFYSFFLGMPAELEDAGRIDGASTLRIFFQIVLPNAAPVLATVCILSFLTTWGMFLWPALITIGEGARPLPIGLATFFGLPPLQWGDLLAYGVMMVAPVVIVFLIFQQWFIDGLSRSGVKG